MADAVERGRKVDITPLVGNSAHRRPMENAVCFTYTLGVKEMLKFAELRNENTNFTGRLF
jgi:hypothetical protein